MYRNAKRPPRGGFRYTDLPGAIDNGPSPDRRASIIAYNARIKAQGDLARVNAAAQKAATTTVVSGKRKAARP